MTAFFFLFFCINSAAHLDFTCQMYWNHPSCMGAQPYGSMFYHVHINPSLGINFESIYQFIIEAILFPLSVEQLAQRAEWASTCYRNLKEL